MTTTVDVIVPCYNYGALLEDCVMSVLTQDGVAVRALIMDDASTDESAEVGRRLAASDRRVEYVRHAVNRGHIATYNEALGKVTADYCMILSADDLLTSGALFRATCLMMAHPDVGFTYGPDLPFRDAPPADRPPPTGTGARILTYLELLTTACRLGHTDIQAPTVLVRSAVHRAIGGYRPELPHSGDTEIWLRMAAHAKVGVLEAPQAFRRLHHHNMSLRLSPLRRLEAQKKAFDTHFRKQQPLPPEIASLQAMVHRTIAEAAFWTGAHAFDAGDVGSYDECLALALEICPEIESWDAWRRLRWKRRLGARNWRAIAPFVARARALSRRLVPTATPASPMK